MQQLADSLWVFDGPAVPFLGLPFSTRMVVARLASGELWVHSPIPLTADLAARIDALGPVAFLMAPNHLHHLFVEEWQVRYPAAQSWGTTEVIRKRPELVFEFSLNDTGPWPWADELDTLLFTGSRLMQECLFHHRASRTLIVTDFVENFSGAQFNRWQTLVARFAGILAPRGRMPLDWRLSFLFNRREARAHLVTVLGWEPERLVMAHGEIIETNATAFLERSFAWLR